MIDAAVATPASPPIDETELLHRADALAGLTLGELAVALGLPSPDRPGRGKGRGGELLEYALGATAGSRPAPDFEHIGVELKTIPIDRAGRPRESTHVCVATLDIATAQRWETSLVWRKLRRVLWLPLQSERRAPMSQRRIGSPLLWSPSAADVATLRADWEEHVENIALGRLDAIDARMGTYLQVRPKAPNSRALARAIGPDGAPTQSLPRGFYLRPQFTRRILAARGAGAAP